MSISHRVSIAWESDDFRAEETTSTLVLTTPSGWFVDTRILRAALQGPANDHKLQRSDIEWAFAGKSISTPLPDGRRHAKWIHWVDDHVALTDPPAEDEGIMSKIEQEPRMAEMEREEGSMRNPATGNVERYVEIWRDAPIRDTPPVAFKSAMLSRLGTIAPSDETAPSPSQAFRQEPYMRETSRAACEACKRRITKCSGTEPCARCVKDGTECRFSTSRPVGSSIESETWTSDKGGRQTRVPGRFIVMQCDEPEKNARGLMIKLGQHVMGVLKVDEHLFVERYTYVGDPIGSWERVCYLRTADDDFYAGLPAEKFTKDFDYGLPEYDWYGLTWKVTELSLA